MTEITFWLIRHIPTGGYLPQPTGYMGRGGSHVEPVIHDPADPKTRPRICNTKRTAINVLSQWLAGKYYKDHDPDWGDSADGPYPVPTRIREEMEIIPINLVIP